MSTWTGPYSEFMKILDIPHILSSPGSEQIIERKVDALYAQHKGEPAWDEAYQRWCETR